MLDKGEVQPAADTAPTTASARNTVQYDLFILKAPFGIVSDSTVADHPPRANSATAVFFYRVLVL